MDKIWLIFKREFTLRVYSKKFWLLTFLGPLSILILYGFLAFIMVNKGENKIEVVIKDSNNLLTKRIPNSTDIYYHFKPTADTKDLEAKLEEGVYDAVVVLPDSIALSHTKYTFEYKAKKALGLDHEQDISGAIEERIRAYKVQQYGLDERALKALDARIVMRPNILGQEEEVSSLSSAIGSGLGFIVAMGMYFIIFFYGMMVMRSVMEEKINRIVEVMISTVKPFHLMLGKIFGVAAAGLLQIIALAILMPAVYLLASLLFASVGDFNFDVTELEAQGVNPEEIEYQVALAIENLASINWFYILVIVLLYFLGGYLLYASLFAAIGSAVGDDQGEGQQLSFPVSVLIIIALYISIAIATSPDSGLAVWSSMVPFFSPIVMCTRLFSDPPFWQIALSLLILFASTFFIILLSSRIYRVGILLYGKKASFKEIMRWIIKGV